MKTILFHKLTNSLGRKEEKKKLVVTDSPRQNRVAKSKNFLLANFYYNKKSF